MPFVIGHFRVTSSLCFKARRSAKPLVWTRFFFSCKYNSFSRERFCSNFLASFWKWGLLEPGNCLLDIVRLPVRLALCCVELHYGTILGTLSPFSLAVVRLRKTLGQNSPPSIKYSHSELPQCSSEEDLVSRPTPPSCFIRAKSAKNSACSWMRVGIKKINLGVLYFAI